MANLKLNDSNVAEGKSVMIVSVKDSSCLDATAFLKVRLTNFQN